MWLVAAFCIAVGIIGTYSKTGFLVFCVIVGLLGSGLGKKSVVFVITAILVGYGVIRFFPMLYIQVLSIPDHLFDGLKQQRYDLWQRAFEMWRESPILGIGLQEYLRREQMVVHNTYLQVLTETGIVGLALYLAILCIPIGFCFRVVNFCSVENIRFGVFFKCVLIGYIGMLLHLNSITLTDVKLLWLECAVFVVFYLLLKKPNMEIAKQRVLPGG